MARQLERHLFTLEEYEQLVEAGGFREDARVELIRGEIVDMAPIGVRHEACVTRLTTLLVRTVGDRAVIWAQNSIRMPGHSRPEPDVALLRWREDYYEGRRPTPEDVQLVIEVADTSLGSDREVKGPLYAEAGIPEYWIVNLRENVIEVFAEPREGAYRRVRRVQSRESLTLPGDVGGEVAASGILGQKKSE